MESSLLLIVGSISRHPKPSGHGYFYKVRVSLDMCHATVVRIVDDANQRTNVSVFLDGNRSQILEFTGMLHTHIHHDSKHRGNR